MAMLKTWVKAIVKNRYAYLGVLLFFSFNANSQVKLLTLNDLEQRFAKGTDTTYVVNFWATWCGPCVAELPSFEQLHATEQKNPVKVILVSLDFKSKLASDVIPFVKKHQLKTEVYVINEPDQQDFIDRVSKNWSGAIPATLLVNDQGKNRAFYEKEFTYKTLIETIEKL